MRAERGLTNIRGQVFLALWDAFKENNIEIPYPHREVVVRDPVRISQGAAEERSAKP